jgi:hypothetical protein
MWFNCVNYISELKLKHAKLVCIDTHIMKHVLRISRRIDHTSPCLMMVDFSLVAVI